MNVRNEKLDFWIKNASSVLLCGSEGVGKTGMSWDAFMRSGLFPDDKLLLYSEEAFFLYGDYEKGEVAFFDDVHSQRAIDGMNEIMNLRMFRGQKLPALRCVWTTVTVDPPEENPPYSKWFEHIVEIPRTLCRTFFEDKFGKKIFNAAEEWYGQLPDDVQVSPRRMDQALTIYQAKGNMRDVLPIISNVSRLVTSLDKGSIKDRLEQCVADNDQETAQLLVAAGSHSVSWAMHHLCESGLEQLREFYFPLFSIEQMATMIQQGDQVVVDHLCNHTDVPRFREVLTHVLAHSSKHSKRIRRRLAELKVTL